MRMEIRTDRHDEANILLSRLYKRAQNPLVLDGTCSLNANIT